MNHAGNPGVQNPLGELCLRYPESLGSYAQLNLEQAASLLIRTTQLAQQVPFVWGYIDRPPEGSTFLVFLLPQQPTFPNDGIRYLEQEHRYQMPISNARVELEVAEVKLGFVPNSQDTVACRVRRLYRLIRGGHPQLVIAHYSRGQQMPIPPAIALQGTRSYPLRVINEPAMYVLGEKAGQKVMQSAASAVSPMGQPGAISGGGMPMGMQNQTHDTTGAGFGISGVSGAHPTTGHVGTQGSVPGGQASVMGVGMAGAAGMNMNLPMGMTMNPRLQQMMIAQQNREMEALERRAAAQQQQHPQHVQAHGHGHPQAIAQHVQPRAAPTRVEDDYDSGDELEQISTRTLALARYKRNHEFMHEVFNYAAFGKKQQPAERPSVYACFDHAEIQAKVAKLEAEVEALKAKGNKTESDGLTGVQIGTEAVM